MRLRPGLPWFEPQGVRRHPLVLALNQRCCASGDDAPRVAGTAIVPVNFEGGRGFLRGLPQFRPGPRSEDNASSLNDEIHGKDLRMPVNDKR